MIPSTLQISKSEQKIFRIILLTTDGVVPVVSNITVTPLSGMQFVEYSTTDLTVSLKPNNRTEFVGKFTITYLIDNFQG